MKLIGAPIIRRRGLGNELFAWSRCVVACEQHSLTRGSAIWRQIHIGPYVRREQDKRQYHRLFRKGETEVRALTWLSAAALGPRFSEEDIDEALRYDRGVVLFDGLRTYFRPLWGHHDVVSAALHGVARRPHQASRKGRPQVALHVRLGDFRPATAGTPIGRNTRIPLDWYSHQVEQVLSAHPRSEFVVFSDQPSEALGALLLLPGVTVASPASALSHLLALASADLIIAGNSTFSAWGAYLGQMPYLTYPGFDAYRTRPLQDKTESSNLPSVLDALEVHLSEAR